ncbi:MAG: hypothetical protein CMJ06_06140 [Pelagibacterales bacterium]|nr:hypothetical protein [Pelagibacterales bacterium]OUU61213.1 MAG: hypothetical protein CBC22_08285 [Alphaproteobacteria bacterium TMED62]|tara:strand:- start:32 stop:682 length:651 start_codon:yes stop_codon:yes gene_type:complete
MVKSNLEVWGYNSYRPFRIYWILKEYGLKFIARKIGSRTGETQTKEYLKMNAKGKIPILKHNNKIISESAAAVNYIIYNYKKPVDFYLPNNSFDKAKVDEWTFFSLMELDCLVIYTLRRHEKLENLGLSNLYGRAPNAVKTSREHFDRMIAACDKNVPKSGWLFGKSPSVADIMFVSCLMVCDIFDIEIKSKNVLRYYNRAKKRKQFIEAYENCFE